MNLQHASEPDPARFAAAADPEPTHVFLVAARHARAALRAIEDGLWVSGAELLGLTLRPVGQIVEAVVRLGHLDEAEAQRLATRLSQGLGVQGVRVEHHWGLK
ncbi:hypothetical protein [Phenylobacterium aquaticum]|uniref:hypothetical protein n=1 Tax=Phenylobacterium aquaticum TaxID=1763816 RepID=UPI001F5E2B4C|nr:hypothetical protein [Phenylobacterium aquaticum]MCI3134056.1 hypothetical protein [Phenylobacterium aquaticum]